MSAPATSSQHSVQDEILAAFQGRLEPVPLSILYRLGLFVVAVAMALLPLLYVGLIALVGCGVAWHAVEDTAILAGRGRTFPKLLVYLAPIVVGPILILFMIKPLFARRAKGPKPRSLDRQAEPLLFAFVERVCRCVGAPVPSRLHVDCQVNASASFRRGILSMFGHDLVLTLGLPLVAGLSMRQLAGVLAHELGHFAQRSGMRLTYVIRKVNHWFARVVYERDAWDERLAATARGVDLRLGVVLTIARFFVWATRKILWVLMAVGHAISCFMLRQMEFDADRYEARLAGSETFETTMERIRVLAIASEGALVDLGESWRERRLGDDLPSLILANIGQIPPDYLAKVERSLREQKTGVFDTHPADRARIRKARAEGARGIFRLERPAADLFADFKALAREATFQHYRQLLGDEVRRENLVPTEALVRHQKAVQDTYAAQGRFFQNVLPPLFPVLDGAPEMAPAEDPLALMQAVRDARQRVEARIAKAREAAERYDKADSRLNQMHQAIALLDAGFSFPARVFELGDTQRPTIDRESRAAAAAMAAAAGEIETFAADSRARLVAALRLLHDPQVSARVEAPEALLAEGARLIETVGNVARLRAPLVELRRSYLCLIVLFKAIEGSKQNAELVRQIKSRLGSARTLLLGIRDAVVGVAYPFEHAGGRVSIAQFAIGNMPTEEDAEGLMGLFGESLANLVNLYYRLLGRLADVAEQVERAMGLEPLPPPPQQEESALA